MNKIGIFSFWGREIEIVMAAGDCWAVLGAWILKGAGGWVDLGAHTIRRYFQNRRHWKQLGLGFENQAILASGYQASFGQDRSWLWDS